MTAIYEFRSNCAANLLEDLTEPLLPDVSHLLSEEYEPLLHIPFLSTEQSPSTDVLMSRHACSAQY